MAVRRSRIVALVSGMGWHVQDLLRAAEIVGVELTPIEFPRLVGRIGRPGRLVDAGGVSLDRADGVLVRMMPPGSLEQVVFRMDALQRVSSAGVRVVNPPRAVEVSVDKYLSLGLLEQAGLPVPPTYAGESAREALEAFEELGGDVVVKPLFGSEGRGLMRIGDRELAWRAFHTIERTGGVIYLQRAVRHPGFDVRAFVIGGRVVGAMRRHAPAGEWRTNVALGGRPESVLLDPFQERIALDAAAAVGAEMAGVDLIDDLDRGGPVVLEVNAVPGWRALAGATKTDIASRIIAHLRGD